MSGLAGGGVGFMSECIWGSWGHVSMGMQDLHLIIIIIIIIIRMA